MSRLAAIQESYVRMHFAAAPPTALPGFFPAFESASHRAEVFGRRCLIARELLKRLPRTFALLMGARDFTAEQLAAAPWIVEFVSSDAFFVAENGLPSAEGFGPGYENVSKYFFWLARRESLDRPEADLSLREALYREFAIFLLVQAEEAAEPFYDALAAGVFWRAWPGDGADLQLLSPDFESFLIEGSGKNTEEGLRANGWLELDVQTLKEKR